MTSFSYPPGDANPHPSDSKLCVSSLGRLAVTVLVSIGLFLSGCSTMHGVAVPQQSGERIALQVGEGVHIQTKSGQSLSFKVIQIEPDTLVGKNIRVSFRDIDNIQVRRTGKVSKGEVIVVVVTVALVAGLVVLLSHGAIGFPAGPP